MSTVETALAKHVEVDDHFLTVELVDGRRLAVPLSWFPRLAVGPPEERGRWELIGNGEGIHWPDLDEDISVDSLLRGRGDTTRLVSTWPRPGASPARDLNSKETPPTRRRRSPQA